MSVSVTIRGDGLAARCCARLLADAGCQVYREGARVAGSLAILVSPATQRLIADVFRDEHLFDGFAPIRKRIVKWGGADPIAVPHAARVVPESALLDRLGFPAEEGWSAGWSILCSRQAVTGVALREFGHRIASVRQVVLRTEADRDACWIESTESGWLFLLPVGDRAALIAVGERSLNESALIAPLIESAEEGAAEFPSHPRVLEQLGGPDWLACGSAAIGFDPICGEGAGNAVREAILAAAVVRAAAAGGDRDALLRHYSARLLGGLERHLETSRQFYATGGSTPWWQGQLQLLEEGIQWTRSALSRCGPPRYRLEGFDLLPLG